LVKKVKIVSYFKPVVRKFLKKAGLVESRRPEAIIAYGGDGTFLYSELAYPGIPKLFIYHNSSCKNCGKHDLSKILKKLAKNKFSMVIQQKLEAKLNNKILTGLNDINTHYQPPSALRFFVFINKRKINGEQIGDGVVITTPYGSSGYFHSITRKKFKKGIGIAFNNTVKKVQPLLLNGAAEITVKITRGRGYLAADCNQKILKLKKGDIIKIKMSRHKAQILKLNGFPIKIKNY
jgi:NAD kinase